MSHDLSPQEALKALARAKVQDVAWASGLKVEDIALRTLELRAAYRFQAEKERREGHDEEAKTWEIRALALLDLLEQFWMKPVEGEIFPSKSAVTLREADKALLRARCIEQGVVHWLAP